MSSSQKIIKYFAITFACIIIASMIGGIVSFIVTIFDISEYKQRKIHELYQSNVVNTTLDIDLKSTDLEINLGDKLLVSSDSKYINCIQDENKIQVIEKSHVSFSNNTSKLIITIPRDLMFDVVDIEAGAGKINIEELETKRLHLDLGAGRVDIKNLIVTERTKIEGGAGKFAIQNGTINNLKFALGVGDAKINSAILGNSTIDASVSKLDVNLRGSINDYEISIDKGIGSIKFNGETLKDKSVVGNGNNYLEINGGVGTIKITTNNN